MKRQFDLGPIPAALWGAPSDRLYLFVHGKMSRKEAAEPFARIAERKGYQTLSFDLAQHGGRKDDAACDARDGGCQPPWNPRWGRQDCRVTNEKRA